MHKSLTRRSWLMASALTAQGAAQESSHRLPNKVRLALIGLEGHTGEILQPLKLLPQVDLVAVSDPDPRRMEAVTKAPSGSGARHYVDYQQMLEQERLDVVGICGSNGRRAEAILACAQHKLHVVAEKPLAIERADLERVKKAVERYGIRLTMLLPMRFSSPYLAIKQIVDAGEIGEVAQIGAQKSYKLGERPDWMRRRSTFGGTIPYIGVHMVDLMRWTSQREMVEAVSFQSRIGFPELSEMENTTATLFRLDNGGAAVLRMDYLRPETAPTHGDDRLRLAGTKGVVEYQQSTGVTLITSNKKPQVIQELPPSRSLFIDFLESVYLGKPCGLELRDIYRVSEIVLAARESAYRSQTMKIG